MHFDARRHCYYFGGAMFAAMWMPGSRALESNATDSSTGSSIIVCPPSAPPPAPPPDLVSWAAHVPAWFWLTFVVMLLTSVGGCGAMGYVVHTVRRFQKRQAEIADGEVSTRLRHGTASALSRLEERVQTMCHGM
ncbi:MAG: hypothetical protein ACKVI4_16635 [Actinomycetales bacterium]|mgnify:CR=1 FL=1